MILLDEDWKPEDRVEFALKCLPDYNPPNNFNGEVNEFRYWKIRDYAYAYRSKRVTPSIVSKTLETQPVYALYSKRKVRFSLFPP